MRTLLFLFVLGCAGADRDGDGFPKRTDCDDNNADVNPAEPEIAEDLIDNDLIDNDCDGQVDENNVPPVPGTYYTDLDEDSYGDDATAQEYEQRPAGSALVGGDCDDTDATEHPGVTWYADSDGDEYGDAAISSDCERGAPTDVHDNTDCDDTDAAMFPGATEICDAKDNAFGYTSDGVTTTLKFRHNNLFENKRIEGSSEISANYLYKLGTTWNVDPPGGVGNLSVEPDFVDPTPGFAALGDYHLRSDSALIHAGDPDIRNPNGTVSDIGAYGGPGTADWEE